MSQVAKAQEPSMEEILASIRRIIADDEAAKPSDKPVAAAAPAPPPAPEAPPPAPEVPPPAPAARAEPPAPAGSPEPMSQDDIDAMLAGFDAEPESSAPAEPVVEPAPAPEAVVEADDEADADVLELTEAMTVEAAAESEDFNTIDTETDVVFAEAAPAEPPKLNGQDDWHDEPVAAAPSPPPAPPPAPEVHYEPLRSADGLLSSQATAAVAGSFGSLAHTVITQNGRTLDDLVREMLRPMLKAWLDENLPGMVERLVRAEIERVSRGQG